MNQFRTLSKQLNKLEYNTYSEYLKSDTWKLFRRRWYSDSAISKRMKKKYGCYVCMFCLSKGRLDLHHKTYKRLGAERLDDVILLCVNCHKKIHSIKSMDLWKATKRINIRTKKNRFFSGISRV